MEDQTLPYYKIMKGWEPKRSVMQIAKDNM